MNYYVYMTINIINYKKYIGITRKPISTHYVGSGKLITKAIKKYGKCFFIRHDLFVGEMKEASDMEKFYIDYYSAVTNKDFYNLRDGGFNGSHGPETSKLISEKILAKYKNDPIYRAKCKSGAQTRDNTNLRIAIKSRDINGKKNGMYGKHHKEESKRNMSIKKKGVKMNLSEEEYKARSIKAKNNNIMMGPKSSKQKAKNRWSALKKSFGKDPIISHDIKMMHDYYEFTEKMNKLSNEHLLEFLKFRFKFLEEELNEGLAAIEDGNAEEIVDSLIDLIVVAQGTLDLYGVDFKKSWYRVLEANMSKTPGVKASRPNPWGLPDLIKPHDFKSPEHHDNVGLFAKLF